MNAIFHHHKIVVKNNKKAFYICVLNYCILHWIKDTRENYNIELEYSIYILMKYFNDVKSILLKINLSNSYF